MEVMTRDIQFSSPIIFDNIRIYTCTLCGSINYFYDDNRLVFVTTHRNTFLHEDRFFFVPRCQRCDTEFAHMIKAVEIMKRSGD